MTGSQILRKNVSTVATARLDRGFTEPDLDRDVEQDLTHWLHQVTGRIHLAINRRIPIGFEDETGFHFGVQPAGENERVGGQRDGVFVDDEHF
jgi:hypothetical protein